MNSLLVRRGLPLLDRARYHDVFDFPVRDYYGRLGFDPQTDSFEKLSGEFIAAYDARRGECPLHAAAPATLAAVQAAGLTQSLLSAYRHETLLEIVGHFGLTGYFCQLSGLADIYARSKVALGRAQLASLGLPPDELVLIGDTVHDLEVARELGVSCVLVAAGHHPAGKLRRHHDQVVPALSGLSLLPGLEALRPAGPPGGDAAPLSPQ